MKLFDFNHYLYIYIHCIYDYIKTFFYAYLHHSFVLTDIFINKLTLYLEILLFYPHGRPRLKSKIQ